MSFSQYIFSISNNFENAKFISSSQVVQKQASHWLQLADPSYPVHSTQISALWIQTLTKKYLINFMSDYMMSARGMPLFFASCKGLRFVPSHSAPESKSRISPVCLILGTSCMKSPERRARNEVLPPHNQALIQTSRGAVCSQVQLFWGEKW